MTKTRLDGPIEGDPFLPVANIDLAAAGYVGEEWFISGSAPSFTQLGERDDDGRWQAAPGDEAPFKTRLVVRRPAKAKRFNGTVIVEWLNVSGGLDAAPDFLFLHRHLMREGAAWVGVSVQKAGIDGGGLVPGMPLKQANPKRYAELDHPGDAYAYGIYSEVGRVLRAKGSGPLGKLVAERVLAVGESQSAGFMVSYVNAIDPLDMRYDGFLIHGRPGGAAAIDGTYLRASPDGDVSKASAERTEAHRIREDARVPVLTVQSETDVVRLGSGRARQPDSKHFRLWELAGASHFDTYGLIASQIDHEGVPIEALAAKLAPTDKPMGMAADAAINSGPQQHYVLNAAIMHLERWVQDGSPPPEAPRLEATDAEAANLVRDENGIVLGGIRTPWVDVPTAALSGDAPGGEGFLFLFGKTLPFDEATLARLYPGGADEHRARFEAATDEAVLDGFILEEDAEEIYALAHHGQQPSGWRIG
jgi:hypothetical protein